MSYPGDEMYCTHCREFADHMTAECQKEQPEMITIPKSEYTELKAIESACQKLVDAVSIRMVAGDDASDRDVWDMLKAHRFAETLLEKHKINFHTFSKTKENNERP